MLDDMSHDEPLEPLQELNEEPSDEALEESNEEPSDKPLERPHDEPCDEPLEEPSEEPSDKPLEQPYDEPSDEPLEDTYEEPSKDQSDELYEKPDQCPQDLRLKKSATSQLPQPVSWYITHIHNRPGRERVGQGTLQCSVYSQNRSCLYMLHKLIYAMCKVYLYSAIPSSTLTMHSLVTPPMLTHIALCSSKYGNHEYTFCRSVEWGSCSD